MVDNTDFTVSGQMGFYIVYPNTEAACEWVEEHVPVGPTLGDGFAVDGTNRVIDLCIGAINDGLTVKNDQGELEVKSGELLVKRSLKEILVKALAEENI